MLRERQQQRDRIRRLVRGMVASQEAWDDAVQEAMIHLSQEEERHPGRSLGWYLNSCRGFIANRLRIGKSVDSAKRRGHGEAGSAEDVPQKRPVLSLVFARDMFRVVWAGLGDGQQAG